MSTMASISQRIVPTVTSCNTCKLSFASTDEVKAHYRDDLHVLNSRRRAQNLPHVTPEAYKLLQKKKITADGKPVISSANSVASKRSVSKKMPVLNKSDEASLTSKQSNKAINSRKDGDISDLIEKLGISEERAGQIINKALGDIDEQASDVSDDWEDDDEVPLPCDPKISIFDGKELRSAEECVDYMSLKFGFFIPDREYLTDLDGLLTYLSEKVKLGGLCLFCQKQFTPGKPCMDHMVSKSHCKIRYEDGVDLDEFEDFYDFSACYEDADSDDGNEDVIQIDAAGDLILPSGLKAGHRMRRIYYKQWFKPEETRESVLAQRREELVRLYGQLGRPFRESAIISRLSDTEVMNMLHQQQRQVRKLKFIEERAQRKHEFRSIKTREYQSTTDRLRSSATTTDKIRDYHSILV